MTLGEPNPDGSQNFSSLPELPAALCANLQQLGYQAMTEIQARSLPSILEGRDVLAQARTGSGKTAAFGIGLLARLPNHAGGRARPRALVLCPTRELADQVAKELRRLARFRANTKILSLCGGMPLGPQLASLRHGAELVVGTPGRIADHLRKASLDLNRLETLVLDEADRMLDMGFREQILDIATATPRSRQTLLFSATFPNDILELARGTLRQPRRIQLQSLHRQEVISQRCYLLADESREDCLAALLAEVYPRAALVYCATRRACQDLADDLSQRGLRARALHGDMAQRDRDLALVQFANGSCPVLVATDVAARGLDIAELPLVVNFDPARDVETHIHRIGRVGRAGAQGSAVTLWGRKQVHKLEAIETQTGQALERIAAAELLASAHDENRTSVPLPSMATLAIDGGRKNRLRPGDILGALTGDAGIPGDQVGKIDIFEHSAYVAVARPSAESAMRQLRAGTIKGRRFKVRKLR